METFGKISAFILLIVSGFFLSLLQAFVFLRIALLFDITFLSSLTFKQTFGLMLVITIPFLTISRALTELKKKANDDDDIASLLKRGFIEQIALALALSTLWFIAYISSLIII